MSRRTAVAVIVVILVVLAVLLALARPWAGNGGSGPAQAPTVAPPSAGAVTATGAPSPGVASVRLSTLNGVLHVYDGDVLTRELWVRMRDFNASDSRIAPYMEWLRNALAPEPRKALDVPWYPSYRYWWFNDREDWRAEPPGNNTIVRMGLVRLPFGAGLVVTAYQAGDGLTVVVHGTIVNETEWRGLLARVAAFMGYHNFPDTWVDLYFKRGTVDYKREHGDYLKRYLIKNINGTEPGWVLWRIKLDGGRSYLEVGGNGTLEFERVIVLLEMPIYWTPLLSKLHGWEDVISYGYWWQAEAAYWDIVGHPALALAVHLASLPGADPVKLYDDVVMRLTKGAVLTCVGHPGNNAPFLDRYYTPFLIRDSCTGVCNEQSRSTSLFASNALGAYTGYLELPNLDHAISVLMYPPYTRIDADGDGQLDSIVIVDTAALGDYVINHETQRKATVLTLEPPLIYTDTVRSYDTTNVDKEADAIFNMGRLAWFYTGVPQAVLALPDWLRAPWLDYTLNKSNFYGYMREAWANDWLYALLLTGYSDVRKAIEHKMAEPVYTRPPSLALALEKVLADLPLVYEDVTPPLRYWPVVEANVEAVGDGVLFSGYTVVGGVNITVDITYKPTGLVYYNITVYADGHKVYEETIHNFLESKAFAYFTYKGKAYAVTINISREENSTDSSTGAGDGSSRMVGVSVTLEPAYAGVDTPWGTLPVFTGYEASLDLNGSSVAVVAVPYTGWDTYTVTVYVDGSEAYTGTLGLPGTVEYTLNGTVYRLTLQPPAPPRLNQTIHASLEPVETVPVPLPNGSVVNVTVYQVNQAITLGNVTIVVAGMVSRLGVDLEVHVYGIPPYEYSLAVEGVNATVETLYDGALHTHTYHEAPQGQLIPPGTSVKITIQPLDIIILAKIP